jgi:DNA polymerase III gamma/tau subunit
VFIAATNNIHKIDPAVRTRYHIKANFNDLPIDEVVAHMEKILQQEQVVFDPEVLKQFVQKNISKGLRELLNLAQIACVTKTFDTQAISNLGGVADESQIIQITSYMLQYLTSAEKEQVSILSKTPNVNEHYESFGKYWSWVNDTINNYTDIDYIHIIRELIEDDKISLDNKQIMIQYLQDIDFKIYKNLHFVAMLGSLFGNINQLKQSK